MNRLLLIEDDQMVREAYEESLRSSGFEVDVAVDGEEGLTKAKEGGYDLILLDMMLPKLDGLGVLRSLRDKPPLEKNGPILLLTNLSHDPVITEAIQLGAVAALIKSDIDPGLLIEAVNNYISKKQPAAVVSPDKV